MKTGKTISMRFTCNGRSERLSIPPHRTLLEMLRDDLQLTGTKEGCGHGECGACTVIVDGKTVNSCLMMAAEVDGKDILTVEGLRDGDRLHPIQQAFIDESGYQCGFCTSGVIMSAKILLEKNSNPTREEIQDALAGNFCRCTGYTKIFESVEAAAKAMRGER
jgi:carbon-monoxide dehydrogenase small subunit